MPSLKLSNPFRRGADRPSLKERAASLKATAGRAMSRKPSGSDAELLALGEQWRAARAAYEAAGERVAQIEASCRAAPPDALFVRDGDAALGIAQFATWQSQDEREWYWKAASDMPFRAGLEPGTGCFRHGQIRTVRRPIVQARLDEVCAAYDQHKREIAEAKAAAGLVQAEAEASRLFAAECAFEAAALSLTAFSLAGLRIQAEIALANEDHQEGQGMAWAVVRTLLTVA